MKAGVAMFLVINFLHALPLDAQRLTQDERNMRFLQNLASTCDYVSARFAPKCADLRAEYLKEGVDPANVTINVVLKKVLVEIGKKLAGLGTAVGSAVGILLVGQPAATEIHDIDSTQIALARRREATIREMSTMTRDSFIAFLKGRKGVADSIIQILQTR